MESTTLVPITNEADRYADETIKQFNRLERLHELVEDGVYPHDFEEQVVSSSIEEDYRYFISY